MKGYPNPDAHTQQQLLMQYQAIWYEFYYTQYAQFGSG
jgi:hypothetical protein